MVGALSTIFSMHKMSSIFGTISNSKTNEKQTMKETTLDLSLNIMVLQIMSSLFSLFF
jgi:hypothetical protein